MYVCWTLEERTFTEQVMVKVNQLHGSLALALPCASAERTPAAPV